MSQSGGQNGSTQGVRGGAEEIRGEGRVKVRPGSSYTVRSLSGEDRETHQANLRPGELGEGEQVGRRED